MSMENNDPLRPPGTRLAASGWDRQDTPMRATPRTRVATTSESWFSLVTMVVCFVLAAIATGATVQAYGPIFLAPMNGP